MPISVDDRILSPLLRSDSMPTIQKGDVVTNSAAIPLGIHCSAKTSVPLPPPSAMMPKSAVSHNSRPAGSLAPRKQRNEENDAAGEEKSGADQKNRRASFEGHTNSKVRRAPEEIHGDQGHVGSPVAFTPHRTKVSS